MDQVEPGHPKHDDAHNGAVFWTGFDKGNKDVAQAYDRSVGGKTVEMTPAGKWLDEQVPYGELIKLLGREPAKTVWDYVSIRFAKGASGEVHAFIRGMREDPEFLTKTYMDIERPILADPENRKVTRIVEHE